MIGATFHQYRITATLGAGGMGEVFRARDTRLGRDVAVKVLPKDFAADVDRLQRFEQEAKTLAALNHPNVLTVFDAGVHEGAPYLVSELLEGRTLREEMNGVALPVRKATDYALQISQGLSAAHGKGVIHRDLKPENLFITKDGRVKILDFGLAKLKNPSPDLRPPSPHPMGRGQGEGQSANPDVPTLMQPAAESTEPGRVMGTPSYMAPEQVRGEAVDHRADIFAFGCVLYEMLSGQRPFKRDTSIATMAAIMNDEPADLTTAKPNLSPALARIVHRCLEKQPDRRFHSAHDLAFAIESAGATSTSTQPALGATRRHPNWQRFLPWSAAAAFAAAFLFSMVLLKQNSSRPASATGGVAPLRRFELTLPAAVRKDTRDEPLHPVISPDGRKLAYADADGLWLRRLDRVSPPEQLVAGENIFVPFWSPQSTEVGYFEGRKVNRVSINGGRPIQIGTVPDQVMSSVAGGAWLPGDRIVFTTGWSTLLEIPVQGGKVMPVFALEKGEVDVHHAGVLPGGRGTLLTIHRADGPDTIAVWTPAKERRVLLQIPGALLFQPVFSPTGHILFHRSDESSGVWTFPFSLAKLERTGEPFRVSDIGMLPSVSDDGTLVFCLRGDDFFGRRQLTWVDRSGKILGTVGPPLPQLLDPHLSPDGRRIVAVARESAMEARLWMFEVAGGGAIPFSRSQDNVFAPSWSNDGRTVVFTRRGDSVASRQVMARPVDGSGREELLFDGLSGRLSRSGKFLVAGQTNASGKFTLGYVPTTGTDRKLVAFPDTYQTQGRLVCRLSPDDQLMAHVSEESGQNQVYVVSFPTFTNRVQVSRGGGQRPEWHPKGTELFFLSLDGRAMMSARLKPDGTQFEEPVKVFDWPESMFGGSSRLLGSAYDVAPDGERFLMLQKVEDKSATNQPARPNVMLVQNWFEEFREKK